MLASLLISAVSLVFLIYWFRYSCLLLLRNQGVESTMSYGERFGFPEVQERLLTERDLDPLHRALQRDYRVMSYLLRHASRLEAQSVEDRMLLLDYRLMQSWYTLTRTAAPEQARRALREMASVLACVARRMGEQSRLHAQI
jgi:hypothetical protein